MQNSQQSCKVCSITSIVQLKKRAQRGQISYSRSSSLLSGSTRMWSHPPTPTPLASCASKPRVRAQASFTHVLLITLVLWISLKQPLCLASRLLPAPLTLQNVIHFHVCIFHVWGVPQTPGVPLPSPHREGNTLCLFKSIISIVLFLAQYISELLTCIHQFDTTGSLAGQARLCAGMGGREDSPTLKCSRGWTEWPRNWRATWDGVPSKAK